MSALSTAFDVSQSSSRTDRADKNCLSLSCRTSERGHPENCCCLLCQTDGFLTPYLVLDLAQVEENYQALNRAFPQVDIHYAMKANPDPRVLTTLHRAGCGFEIASSWELNELLRIGVSAKDILCLHPIKSPDFIKQLHQAGVRVLAADSSEEIDKIAAFAPESQVLLRVSVSNEGSGWDLSGKFGVAPAEILPLLQYSHDRGLNTVGLTIHVGSQCTDLQTWKSALTTLRQLFRVAKEQGHLLKVFSLGGGIPVSYVQPAPNLSSIYTEIKEDLDFFYQNDCRITFEPGRAIVASAGTLVTSVIGVAQRTENWAYVDTGTYNGLVEAIEIRDLYPQFYPLVTEHPNREMLTYQIAGPSCAGVDVPFRDVRLPRLDVGDRLMVRHIGAYTLSCSAPFNGFPVPTVIYLQDLPLYSREESHPYVIV